LPRMQQLKNLFINGVVVLAIMAATQLILNYSLEGFMLYQPPIGYAFFLMTWYLIQPLIVGASNVIIRHRLLGGDGWTVGLWLNGLFLILLFGAINMVVNTVGGLEFSLPLVAAEVLLLAVPFGFVAEHSNA
jgi:hypothetical protein